MIDSESGRNSLWNYVAQSWS